MIQKRTGNGNTLFLTAREQETSLTNVSMYTFRESIHKIQSIGHIQSLFNALSQFLFALVDEFSTEQAISDIFKNSRGKKNWFLADERDMLAKPPEIKRLNVLTV